MVPDTYQQNRCWRYHAEDRDGDESSQPGGKALARLRQYGIRTATDLIQAYDAAGEKGREDALLSLLDDEQTPRGVHRLGVILSTLRDDSWLNWLLHWMHRTALSQEVCPLEEFSRLEAKDPHDLIPIEVELSKASG